MPVWVAGFERGVRPIGLWSISTTLSSCLSPSILLCSAAFNVVALFKAVAANGIKVRLIKVDFPEPETPVIQVINPSGMVKSTLFRLLPLAPISLSSRSLLYGVRSAGMAMERSPDKYCPVIELGFLITSVGVPWAITCPPCTPAPGQYLLSNQHCESHLHHALPQ